MGRRGRRDMIKINNTHGRGLLINVGDQALPVYELRQDAVDMDGREWVRGTAAQPASIGAAQLGANQLPAGVRPSTVRVQTIVIGDERVRFAVAG